jgi:hypothetical protein
MKRNVKWIVFFSVILLNLQSCATNETVESTNKPSVTSDMETIFDATIIVCIPQDKLLADHINRNIPALTGGIIWDFLEENQKSKAYKAMLKTIQPLASNLTHFRFRKGYIHQLKKKAIFTQPDRIIFTHKHPKNKTEVKAIVDSAPTDNVIFLYTDYKLDISYRSLTVNTMLSVWRKNSLFPSYETFLTYNSEMVTFDHSIMVIERSLPLWQENNALRYKNAYYEGINESIDLVINALTERHNYETITEDNIFRFFSYTDQRINVGKTILVKSPFRRHLYTALGHYHSIPTHQSLYKNLIAEINSLMPEKARLVIYYPQGATHYQPHLLIDGVRYKTDLYIGGFFYIDLEPGQHTFTLGQDGIDTLLSNIVVGKIENNIKPITVDLIANKLYYLKFRQTPGLFGPNFDFKLVNSNDAIIEVRNLEYTGNPK